MGDSDNEVEEFVVTDYDLQNEFFPGMKRRKMTKEQTMLGIWAGRDSDEDDDMGRRKPNYSSPMQFISGGVVKNKDEEVLDKVFDNERASPESSKEQAASGSKPEKSRKLFQPAKQPAKNVGQYGADGSKVFTRKVQTSTGKEFGSWEQHTKGFGLKMLQKMGYEPGKGLGKEGQGIATPVEAFKRGGRGALSFYGPEKHAKKQEAQATEEDIEEEEFREQLRQWKKSEVKGKPKYVYKTADEVKAAGKTKRPGFSLATSNIKVVDMTGREAKILSGYGSFATQHANPEEDSSVISREKDSRAFSLPELEYNLTLLLDMSESEIVQADKQLRHERDLLVNLKHEEERLSNEMGQEEKDIKQLIEVLDIIERCQQHSSGDSDQLLTLEDCETLFERLQREYAELYKMYELVTMAVPLVFPKIKNHFERWNPLHNPSYGIDIVKRWKRILEDPSKPLSTAAPPLHANSMDAYERLIWEIWMPFLRRCVGIWNPRNCDPLVEVLENWLPLLPPWIYENILNQILLPRLQREVDAWNPLIDHVMVHVWIHPWLPLMGDKLEVLYIPIRQKLGSALTNWHPSDPSAKAILEPWLKVFSKGSMDAFVLRCIYPKLSQCLSEFVINPHQQHLEPFHWVMAWKSVIPFQHFVSLLEKHFFPKWMQVLRNWLCNRPNYDEITKWYMGWKTMFDDELLSNAAVKVQFNRGLDMMNQAVSSPASLHQPGARENVAYLTNTERRREQEAISSMGKQNPYAEQARSPAAQNIPTNFKDLLEKMAKEYDLDFLPCGRRHEGKALYTYGKLTIFIERGVVFYQAPNGSFNPVSITNLVNLAK